MRSRFAVLELHVNSSRTSLAIQKRTIRTPLAESCGSRHRSKRDLPLMIMISIGHGMPFL